MASRMSGRPESDRYRRLFGLSGQGLTSHPRGHPPWERTPTQVHSRRSNTRSAGTQRTRHEPPAPSAASRCAWPELIALWRREVVFF
ncbi:hypothetical protein CEXT_681691 [Caerostris extrusa]|uniref:Uncharacterized protein n=1 Tax=Caerostris extrusa TaxID=172846 RepID=A0AAV4NBN5_CAEEX|nr:hypothetical protein CEXT_681691 [Caerostris extrusa]